MKNLIFVFALGLMLTGCGLGESEPIAVDIPEPTMDAEGNIASDQAHIETRAPYLAPNFGEEN